MTWHEVAQVGEITSGKPKIVTVNHKEIGIFCERERYFAVLNFCPHFGAPVCEGKVFGAVTATEPGAQTYDHDRLILRCPWHRWEFDLETGRALTPIRQRLKTYPVQIGEGEPPSETAPCNNENRDDNKAVTTYDVRVEGGVVWIQM